MYFDINPKTRKEDLFGMSYQLELLKKYLSDDSIRMIVIKGLRRTGKTSLLNVTLNEISIINVKIDVREAPAYDRKEFMIFLIKKIRDRTKNILNKIIENISGIGLGHEKFSFELFFSKEENIALFFESLNKQLERKKQSVIIAFDEAQLLKKAGFDLFLASVFDNYKNIKIVLTGSEVGMIDKLLGKSDYKAPLFGRAYMEIDTKRLGEEEVIKFLKEGFEQINKKIDFEEAKQVIEDLDGIIGWATYYGWFRYKGLSHKIALEKVKEEGRVVIKKELETFLDGRNAKAKYLKIMRYLIKGHDSWKVLKQAFRKEGLRISDSQLNLYLKELVDFGFVEKLEDKYFVADPLLNSIK